MSVSNRVQSPGIRACYALYRLVNGRDERVEHHYYGARITAAASVLWSRYRHQLVTSTRGVNSWRQLVASTRGVN